MAQVSNMNFVTADPYAFLASAGTFDAQDIFGPPSSTLDAAYDSYPGARAQEATDRAYGSGGGVSPWWSREEIHSVLWMVLGGVMVHLYLRA